MQLVNALACGVASAANGWATIVNFGTAQDATVYSDPKGADEIAGPQYALGAEGELECYVQQSVTVRVYDSLGNLKRTFTQMAAARDVEYIGRSFTGVDYDTAASNVNEPVSLQAILDLWYTNAGAVDFKIQKDVASTPAAWTLKRLGVTVGTAFISVKDPEYGAKGDGSTNDTTAIQNAINAAEAAGGGVVLIPPGTYAINAALVIDSAGVQVWGIGRPTIRSTVSNANGLTITASNTVIEGIEVEVANAVGADSTGYGISLSGADYCVIRGCSVNGDFLMDYSFARGISAVDCDDLLITGCPMIEGTAYSIIATSTGTSQRLSIVANFFLVGEVRVDDHWYVVVSSNNGTGVSFTFDTVQFCAMTGNILNQATLALTSVAGFCEVGNMVDRGSLTLTNTTPGVDNIFLSMTRYRGEVASQAALPLTRVTDHDYYRVTGTTNITSIAAATAERGWIVTLTFADALTFTDGSNLSLAGNFVTTASDTITLMYDGSSFLELSRSAN